MSPFSKNLIPENFDWLGSLVKLWPVGKVTVICGGRLWPNHLKNAGNKGWTCRKICELQNYTTCDTLKMGEFQLTKWSFTADSSQVHIDMALHPTSVNLSLKKN